MKSADIIFYHFIRMSDHFMSASFTLRASKSDDLFFKSIVIASEAWRSHVRAHRHEIAAVVSLLATTSPTTSTRE